MKSIFTFVFTAFVGMISFAEITTSEKDALLQLNHSTNGSQWTTKWNLNSPVATWYGVTVQNDKVVAIDLSSNNLTGTLPSAISNLIHLKSLVLFQNEIGGDIPASIGQLKALEQLNLSFNKLSGVIPEGLTGATSLKSLELFLSKTLVSNKISKA